MMYTCETDAPDGIFGGKDALVGPRLAKITSDLNAYLLEARFLRTSCRILLSIPAYAIRTYQTHQGNNNIVPRQRCYKCELHLQPRSRVRHNVPYTRLKTGTSENAKGNYILLSQSDTDHASDSMFTRPTVYALK